MQPPKEKLSRETSAPSSVVIGSPVPFNQGQTSADLDAIAVIGMACQLPGAKSIAEYARLLESNRSVIREIPTERFQASEVFDANPNAAKTYCKWGAFLDTTPWAGARADSGTKLHLVAAIGGGRVLPLVVAVSRRSGARDAAGRPAGGGVGRQGDAAGEAGRRQGVLGEVDPVVLAEQGGRAGDPAPEVGGGPARPVRPGGLPGAEPDRAGHQRPEVVPGSPPATRSRPFTTSDC